MKLWQQLTVCACPVIWFVGAAVAEEAEPPAWQITSFEEAEPQPPCLELGSWFPQGGSIFEESRVREDGDRNWVLEVRYQYLKPRTYGGLYVKWDASQFSRPKYEALSFWFKGGEGAPPIIKVELKIPGEWAWRICYVDLPAADYAGKWAEVRLPLEKFIPFKTRYDGEAEIVLTLEEEQTTRLKGSMKGVFFVDHLRFLEKSEQGE